MRNLNQLKIYKDEVENQQNRKNKVVRFDHDGEYRYDRSGRYPGPFTNFLKECGIINLYTMPGTPHQTGIAER